MENNSQDASMSGVWREVVRLIEANAQHRKGFCLREIENDDFVLSQAEQEMTELRESFDAWQACSLGAHRMVAMEIGDVIGVLFHLAIRMGHTESDMAGFMLAKFKERFAD